MSGVWDPKQGKWSYLRVPYRRFDDMELKLSRELDKSPSMIRFYIERMIHEFTLNRPLAPEEIQHLSSKVSRSFPRKTNA